MTKKYKTPLVCIGILLIGTLLLFISYIEYQRYIESKSPLVVVKSGLSINFLQGNKVRVKKENKTTTFSITNNSENEQQYFISIEDIVGNQAIKYDLIEQNGKIKLLQNDVSKDYNNLASMLKIGPGETHFYTLILYGTNNTNFIGKLSVQTEEEETEEYFASTILKKNEIKKEPLTPVGTSPAILNEGLIETTDDFGTFYYFRGNVDNNYVLFADLVWRITKINSDGSIRLILNDYPEAMGNFYDSSTPTIEEKMDFSKNKMNQFLNIWYQEKLNNYDTNLISSKYCVDDEIEKTEETTNYYLASSRLIEQQSYSSNCAGRTYTSRVGLLSADEIIMAGGMMNTPNKDYYLYIPEKTASWWTLTPSLSNEENIMYFEVKMDGSLASESIGTYFKGIRPVVNLIKKTSVTGKGLANDPYILK